MTVFSIWWVKINTTTRHDKMLHTAAVILCLRSDHRKVIRHIDNDVSLQPSPILLVHTYFNAPYSVHVLLYFCKTSVHILYNIEDKAPQLVHHTFSNNIVNSISTLFQ